MDFRAGWLRLPARKSGCLRLFCVTLDSRLNAARALSCPRSTAYTFSQHAYSTPGATHHYASSIKRPHPHRRWSCAFVVALRALRPERHKQGQRRKRRAVTPRMNVPKPAVLLCRGQQLTTRTRSTPGQLQRLLNRLLQAVCSEPFLVPWTCRRIPVAGRSRRLIISHASLRGHDTTVPLLPIADGHIQLRFIRR